MSISVKGTVSGLTVSGLTVSGLFLRSIFIAGLFCLIMASVFPAVLFAASPAFAQQGAANASAAAPIGPADGEQHEWRSGGAVMASLKFGSREGEIGCADPAAALYGFISPTSLFYKNGALFILDAPNFRINKYVAKGPGKPFVMDKTIVLYEKPSSQSQSQPQSPSSSDAAIEGAGAPPLFTDLSVLDNGAIFVASSREKLIYHYDASGVLISRISPKVKLDGITRIWAESEKKILIEDPFGGKIYVINSSGALIYELDLNFQPLILPSGETVKVEYSEDAAASREITIKTYKIPAKLESASIKTAFHLPVQNFMALGADGDNNLTAYAVLGAYNDAPSEAYFVKINMATGKIIDKTPAPISPEMSCMRYVRAASGNGPESVGSGGPFIFARSNEDEYLVTKHDFKR